MRKPLQAFRWIRLVAPSDQDLVAIRYILPRDSDGSLFDHAYSCTEERIQPVGSR
jgi:hypothetical protein